MQNFIFQNPVKIFFGKGQIHRLRSEIPVDAKVFLLCDGEMIKETLSYQQTQLALYKYDVIEFSDVKSNPTVERLLPAIEQVKQNKVTFILALGGGSVIDAAKFIAAAACYSGEPWDLLEKQISIQSALPIGVVLTLPASGSEMNQYTVISNQTKKLKLECRSSFLFPQFSILDPEMVWSVPKHYLLQGIVDAFSHVIEQYITYPAETPLQDGIAETILCTLINSASILLNNSHDYDACAHLMWAASLAANELLSSGAPEDWAAHQVGLELTALYGLDHPQTIAITLPAVLKRMAQCKRDKLLQYSRNVWDIKKGSEEERIRVGIEKTSTFFETCGVHTSLSAYTIPFEAASLIPDRLEARGVLPLGEKRNVTKEVLTEIFELMR